jgi:Arc/MetJ-type ribon-helix-helix transcriptional regulator
MYKQNKPVRVGMTIKADLLKQMKDYLKQVNDDKSLKYVSQSEFVNEAIKQLLKKELKNG